MKSVDNARILDLIHIMHYHDLPCSMQVSASQKSKTNPSTSPALQRYAPIAFKAQEKTTNGQMGGFILGAICCFRNPAKLDAYKKTGWKQYWEKSYVHRIIDYSNRSVFWYCTSIVSIKKENFSEKPSQQHGEHHHHQLANKLLFFPKNVFSSFRFLAPWCRGARNDMRHRIPWFVQASGILDFSQ